MSDFGADPERCQATKSVNVFEPVDPTYPFHVETSSILDNGAYWLCWIVDVMKKNGINVDEHLGTYLDFNGAKMSGHDERYAIKRAVDYQIRNGVYKFDPSGPEYDFMFTWSTIVPSRCFLSFRSRSTFEVLMNQINKVIEAKQNSARTIKSKTPIFRYQGYGGWTKEKDYQIKPRSQIVGYDHYIDAIMNSIRNHEENTEHLERIGENKSLNFLLYGAPGQGKSSILRIVASELGMAIFIVKPLELRGDNIYEVLNPKHLWQTMSNGDKFGNDDTDSDSEEKPAKKKKKSMRIMIVFEDFDRFLSSGKRPEVMSEFLNGLDGICNSNDVVRFFTGNDCQVILNNEALINRMAGRFKFDYPTEQMYRQKLLDILVPGTLFEQADFDTLIEKAKENKVTMRPFISHAVRFLFDKNPIKSMLENAAQFLPTDTDDEKKDSKKNLDDSSEDENEAQQSFLTMVLTADVD